MTNVTRGCGLLFAGLIGALVSGAANAQNAQPATGDPAPPPSYDFVQQAGGMTYDGSSLTLTDANTGVLFFSDRPYRLGGQVSNADFAEYWEKPDGFQGDPPNAVVSILSETDKAPALVELTSAETDGASVVYGVKVLRGDLPESAKGIALFIDRSSRPRHGGRNGEPHRSAATAPGGVGFEPYGPYCYHAPQDPHCRAWHHPHHPYYPPYPPYHPSYGPYYHPGAAYAAGVATGAAIANANKQPVYYYYPIPTGPLPANCWINSQHTQMVCSVPLQ